MSLFVRRIVFAMFVSTLVACSTKGVAPYLQPEQVSREYRADLSDGDAVLQAIPYRGRDYPLYRVHVLFDRPRQDVWKAITTYDRYAEYFPVVDESRVLGSEARNCDLRLEFSWLFISYWSELELFHDPEHYGIKWRSERGELKEVFGNLKLTPYGESDEKTLMVLEIYFDTGSGFINWVINLFDKTSFSIGLNAARDYVQEFDTQSVELASYARPADDSLAAVKAKLQEASRPPAEAAPVTVSGMKGVAVYPFGAKGGASGSLAEGLTSLFANELAGTRCLRIVAEDIIEDLARQQALEQQCGTEECQVDLARQAKANLLVRGDLVRLGEDHILTAQVIDLESSQTVFRERASASGKDELVEATLVLARRIQSQFVCAE